MLGDALAINQDSQTGPVSPSSHTNANIGKACATLQATAVQIDSGPLNTNGIAANYDTSACNRMDKMDQGWPTCSAENMSACSRDPSATHSCMRIRFFSSLWRAANAREALLDSSSTLLDKRFLSCLLWAAWDFWALHKTVKVPLERH